MIFKVAMELAGSNHKQGAGKTIVHSAIGSLVIMATDKTSLALRSSETFIPLPMYLENELPSGSQ